MNGERRDKDEQNLSPSKFKIALAITALYGLKESDIPFFVDNFQEGRT